MGVAYNKDVKVLFSVHDEASVEAIGQLPELQFVLAKPETQAEDTRLSLVVIGPTPEQVEDYLNEQTDQQTRSSALKHALEDLRNFYHLAKLETEARRNPKAMPPFSMPPARGCCTLSDGVSVLVVNRPEGETEFRQALLLDKTLVCLLEPPPPEPPSPDNRKMLRMTVRDRRDEDTKPQ